MSRAETNVAAIANSLRSIRGEHQRLTLFLGSRAGGLFNNKHLYMTLERFSLRDFDGLSNIERFDECYKVLSKCFSETERHDIIVGALSSLRYREEDEILAELVKAEIFETIITTNIDPLLEDACARWNMKIPEDYQVIIRGEHEESDEISKRSRPGCIIKVFGDLISLRYNTAGNELELDADKELKYFLESRLVENVLVIGYDPTWDKPLEQVFPAVGGRVWYVNEEQPLQRTHLAHILNRRNSKSLIGKQGSYSSFLKTLYSFLGESVKREIVPTPSFPLLSQPPAPDKRRTKVFISYSDNDGKYLERLHTHLKGYLRLDDENNLLDIWDATKIASGMNWKEEIKKALAGTKVAVLLLSANFLASKLIREYEIPILLEEARKKDITLLPISITSYFKYIDDIHNIPKSFAAFESLYHYSVISSASKPMEEMSLYEQEVVWAKLAERIYDILNSQE